MNREAFFDNAKLFLIFLVVFGHLIQPLITESPVILTMYQFIYLFHMPAMILLTGFFAKGIGKLGYVSNLMRKLLLPYLLFQLIYSSYFYYTGSEGWDTPLFYPHWSLWFLLSLFSWHILLIFFKKIPPFFGIFLAVILGLLVGYIDTIGHTYSISRTFVFFPFFLWRILVNKGTDFSMERTCIPFDKSCCYPPNSADTDDSSRFSSPMVVWVLLLWRSRSSSTWCAI